MSNSAIVKTEAFVLRGLDYGETSRIVTLFTRKLGKIGVIARGARNPKSRFGSTLEVLSNIQTILYVKPTRDLQSLTETSHVRTYPEIHRSMERLRSGFRIVELVSALMRTGQPSDEVFTLLETVFDILDRPAQPSDNVLPYFQLQLASIQGFSPSFTREAVAAVTGDFGYLDLETGSIGVDRSEGSHVSRTERTVLRAFSILARAPIPRILRMTMPDGVRRDVETLVSDYLRYHFEEVYPRRSEHVFSRMELAGGFDK